MFATLLGGLPRPVDDLDQAIEMAIRAQAEAGLEPITDGRLRDPEFERLGRLLVEGPSARPLTVDAWRLAADLTDRAVKQSLPGPYSLGRRLDSGSRARERRTLAVAEALAAEVDALARAGCPLVEIEESEAREDGPKTYLNLNGCLLKAEEDGEGDEWTELLAPEPGVYRLAAPYGLARGTPCPDELR